MRGARAKALREMAYKKPAKMQTGFYGKTFIHGGARRTYQNLKRLWRQGVL